MQPLWEGRSAIVTGAASGLGAAVARMLLTREASVLLVDRDGDGLERLAAEAPGRARVHCCDVAAPEAATESVSLAVAEFGGLDTLITAAGILHSAPLPEATLETIDAQLAVNLRAPLLFAQAASEQLSARRGSIVFFSSAADRRGFPGSSVYCATKGGISALTIALAAELGPHGVRVNAIGPGTVETGINRAALSDPTFRRSVVEDVPLGRLGVPREIAETVVFLASDQSSYTSGQVLLADGGWASS